MKPKAWGRLFGVARLKRNAAALAAVPTLVLTACAAPVGPELWAGGASAQQLARDEYECRRDAEMAYRGAAWDRVLGAPGEKLYSTCMAAKGYTRR